MSDVIRWKNIQQGIDMKVIAHLLEINKKDEKWLSKRYGHPWLRIGQYMQEEKEMPVLLYHSMKFDMEQSIHGVT